MLYRLMIILVICSVASADITFLVGGAESTAFAGGAFDPDQRTVSEAAGGDGRPLYSANGRNFADDGGEEIEIEIPNASADWVGVYVLFHNSDGTEPAERAIITSVDTSGDPDLIVIEADYIDGTTCDVDVGGAVKNTYGEEGTDEDGKDWDLEGILDSQLGQAASQQVKILIRTQSDVDPLETIMIDAFGGSGANWKRLIGVDSEYEPLSVGNYAVYDCGVTGLTAPIFKITVNNIRIENIAALNPAGNASTPIQFNSSFENAGDNTVFLNCKSERAYWGFYLAAGGDRASLIDCYVVDPKHRSILSSSVGLRVSGGLFEMGNIFPANEKNTTYATDTFVNKATFVGGAQGGIAITGPALIVFQNCDFIGMSEFGFNVNNASVHVSFTNCKFDVVDTVNDEAIHISAGSITEFSNLTDAAAANSGFQDGSDSVSDLTFTNTDPWVDLSTGDYRTNWGETVASTYVVDVGRPPYHGPGTNIFHSRTSVGPFGYQQAKGREKYIDRRGN